MPSVVSHIVLDIVVAEDDAASRVAMCKAVQSLGHACRAAASGEEAWALIQERRPDVVLSDWQMPGVSGAELCRRTRSPREGAPYTYFILVTGFRDRAHLLEGMAAGADDYQRKPVDLDELEARLVTASRVVALHRELAMRTEELQRDSQRFRAASRTDPLTGIGNRLRLEEELEAARARAHRYGHRHAIAMCDLDHFKALNDGFGHLAGDDALRRIAAAIVDQLRTGDTVFRYGGEELVVLLSGQTLEQAVLAMDRIRRAVEGLGIPMPALGPTPAKSLTMSVGVTELDPNPDVAGAESLARADAALYLAKSQGRNRVEAFRVTSSRDEAAS